MELLSGSVSLAGSVAFAAQTPWILNASVEQNIVFDQPMDKERYRRAIKACQVGKCLLLLLSGKGLFKWLHT